MTCVYNDKKNKYSSYNQIYHDLSTRSYKVSSNRFIQLRISFYVGVFFPKIILYIGMFIVLRHFNTLSTQTNVRF